MKRATIYFIAIFFSWIGINQGLSPSDGIETHGKEDSTSQKIGSNYFRQLGIPFNRWSHKHQNIKANKKLIMTLEFPSNVAVIIGLNKNGKDVNGNYFSTDVQDKGKMEQYKLQIFFPEKGEYTLMLFAKSKSAGGSFPYLTAYNITATEATTEEEIIFGGYAGNLFRTNSEWSKLGISLSGFSHKKDVIATTEDHVIITFKAKKDFPLYKNLKNEKNKNYESRIVDNYVDGEKRVIAFFPKPGKYRVELYSFPNGKYVPVAYYDVYTKKGISSNLALDKIMSPYLFKSKEWNETSFLNSRMEVKSIKLSNKIYHSAQKNGIVNILFCGLSNDGPPAPVIRFAQNGSSYLAWTDKKFITHVDKLNENQDIVQVGVIKLSNRLVYDMVVQKDGITLLTQLKGTTLVYLTRFNLSGKKVFETKVIGVNKEHKNWVVGDQGFDMNGRAHLIWTGNKYATYMNTMRKWRDNVIHQSELLFYYDKTGRYIEKGSFGWNVSHSFRPFSIFNGSKIFMATTGDAYPRALNFSIIDPDKLDDHKAHIRTKQIFKATGRTGDNDAHMSTGNVVAVNDGFLISFDAKEERKSYDVGFFHISTDGEKINQYWVTNSSKRQDRTPKMAKYGNNYFIAWGSKKTKEQPWGNTVREMEILGAIVNKEGKMIKGPEKLKIYLRGMTRLFNYPNGDIGWVSDVCSPDQLKIVRLKVN